MSLYDELPVFKASYDLLLDIFQFTANFKREYKYTVGESLKNQGITLGNKRAASQPGGKD
jgi:hypothetical protein